MFFSRLSTLPSLFFLITLFFGLVQALPTPENGLMRRGSGLKTSDNPADWPSDAQLTSALKTAPNKAFFWTGRTNDVSVEEEAASIAAAASGATLESSLAKANIIMPSFDVRNQKAVDIWVAASKIFAQGASGKVFCVQGAQLRQGNVFESDELPILKANSKVTSVIRIDSTTKAQTTIKRDVEDDEEEEEVEELEKRAVKKPVAKKPVAAAKKPVVKKPVAKAPVAKKPVAVKKPAATAKKPAVAAKKPAVAAKKPAVAAKKPAVAAKKPAAVAKKPAVAAKKPAVAAKKPAVAAKKATTTAKKATATKAAATAKPSVAKAAPGFKDCISHPVRCA